MAIKIVGSEPQDFTLDGPDQNERWMCQNCGIVFDFQFEPGSPGWPDYDPPLDADFSYLDEDGEWHWEEPDRTEKCPRCGITFDDTNLLPVTLRIVQDLASFYKPGQAEGLHLELKESFSVDRIRHTMAAFASTEGGKIILGVDNHGTPVGLKNISTMAEKDKFAEDVRRVTAQIKPASFKYNLLYFSDSSGLDFAVIWVTRGPAPVYFANGKPYIRELDVSRPASPEEVEELHRRHPQSLQSHVT